VVGRGSESVLCPAHALHIIVDAALDCGFRRELTRFTVIRIDLQVPLRDGECRLWDDLVERVCAPAKVFAGVAMAGRNESAIRRSLQRAVQRIGILQIP
jgi:hypothetical protein